jgi:hypothetical protein
MGSTHSFLNIKGFVPQAIQLQQLPYATFHVNVLGSHYSLFASNFFKLKPLTASKLIINQLPNMYPVERTILYMDNGRTKEKALSINKRPKVGQRYQNKFVKPVQELEKKARDGKKMSGTEIKKSYKLARNAFKPSTAMKTIVTEPAKEADWSVHV